MLTQEPPKENSHRPPEQQTAGEPLPNTGLMDLTALRTVLTGESIVDSGRLHFADRESVDRFIRLSGFDTDNPLDVERLRDIHREAVVYLTEEHGYQMPATIRTPNEIHNVFLIAGQGQGQDRDFACMTLKVMHILHHISVRELVFNTAISEAELLSRLNTRVFTTIDAMRAAGIEVSEFGAGKKSRASITTKLLAKRESLATRIFDRLRFRVVLNKREDLVAGLVYILRHLVPFNYVVPGQSINGIITMDDIVQGLKLPADVIRAHWEGTTGLAEETRELPTQKNTFSGPSYRCVNFVAELPLRIDDVVPDGNPAIAFVQTEIQLMDSTTGQANNSGENAHSLYKARQRRVVRGRIERPGQGPMPRYDDSEN